MFEQGIVTRLLISIRRVKEPRVAFAIRWASRRGVPTVIVVTLFSWRVRLGEFAFPLLWWVGSCYLTYLGIGVARALSRL
jgi:threonine/homoserine/homoserine lactone efflux protein